MIFYLTLLLMLAIGLVAALVQAARQRRRCRRLHLENQQLVDSLDRLRNQVQAQRRFDPWAFVSHKPSGLGRHA